MTQTLVYVSCAESREIHVFSLDSAAGELRPRQCIGTRGAPSPLKLDRQGRVLYAGTREDSGSALAAYAIDASDGRLSLLGTVPAPGRPTYVACDNARRFGFSASYGDNNLAVFPLDAAGAPGPVSQVEENLMRAHAAVIDATNRWLIVPTLGVDAIRVYRLDAGGVLVANDPPAVIVRSGCGPRHFVFSPDNRHAHCLNELDGSIDAFDFDAATGTLERVQSISMLPHGFDGKPWAAELRGTPDGRFLYATERTSSVIAVFAVDLQSGRLSAFGHYPTETQPRGMAIDPSGRWLVAAGQLSAGVTLYERDGATGRLTTRHRQATGKDPICVEILTLPDRTT